LGKLFSIWIIFTLFEILQFKGVPLISVVFFKDYGKDYTTFGLPTLHGLLNALYFTITIGYYIYYKNTGDRSSLFKFRYLLLWPILLMSRALLLWILIEYFCCYLIFNKINFRKIFKIVIVLISFITIFGLIGDNRSENTETRFTDKFISDQYQGVGDILPSGFVWVYLYATTPINNIVFNIENLNPQYNFYYTFAALIPSFLREKFYPKNNSGTLVLYEEAFNVSSYFSNYLFDLGITGTIIFVSFLQFIICIIYFSAKSMKVGSIISYTAVFYALFTSVFFDNFISLVTIFQIFIGASLNYFLYYKKNKNV
jgi:oligosaccharide repeat unit polymerase